MPSQLGWWGQDCGLAFRVGGRHGHVVKCVREWCVHRQWGTWTDAGQVAGIRGDWALATYLLTHLLLFGRMGLHVLAEGAGVRVALGAARDLTSIWLL